MSQRRLTANQKAFEREVKRLQRLVKIAENKGIVFLSSPIPEQPNRITEKRLKKIQETTKTDLESKGYSIDKETGELFNYIPPKKSKQRKVKISKFQPKPTGIRGGSVKIKPTLSPEELRKVRIKAARKAAESRRKHEAEDPEFKERMDAIRRKNLEKAREAKRKKEEPEELELPKAPERKTTEPEEPEIRTETEEPKFDSNEYYQPTPEELPSEDTILLENFRSILINAEKDLANVLLNFLNDTINNDGYDDVILRLHNSSERILELAQVVAYDSDPQKLRISAYSLAYIISGGSVPSEIAKAIEMYSTGLV